MAYGDQFGTLVSTQPAGGGAQGMGLASGIMGVAGALGSAIGAYYGAAAMRRQLRFQSQMAEQNAKYAEQAAQAVLARGARAQQQSRLATAALKGKQRVAYAANGIDLSSDTVIRTLTSTDLLGEADALAIEQSTLEEKWNAKRQATNYRSEAAFARASQPSAAGAAFSSLLGSSGQVASQWYQLKREGAI